MSRKTIAMDYQAGVVATPRGFADAALFDADGFLLDSAHWTTAMAASLARRAGIEDLTAMHWNVIHFVRDRYFAVGALPVTRLVCRAAGLDARAAHQLFSSCRSLWQISGLPNPGEEAKSYMN